MLYMKMQEQYLKIWEMNLIKRKILSRARSIPENWVYFSVGYELTFKTHINGGGCVHFQVVQSKENENIIKKIYDSIEKMYKFRCFKADRFDIFKKHVYWECIFPSNFNKKITTNKTCKLKRKESV